MKWSFVVMNCNERVVFQFINSSQWALRFADLSSFCDYDFSDLAFTTLN